MSGKHAVLTLVCVKFSFSPKLSRPNWLMVTGDSSSSNIVSISPIDFSKFHCLYYWMIFWSGQLTKKGSQCALVVKLGEGKSSPKRMICHHLKLLETSSRINFLLSTSRTR